MSFTATIVGRPNVGKSTLFNRLIRKKLAIVHDLAGVTRDWRESEAFIGDLPFTIIDTAGFEESDKGTLEHAMMVQTEKAIALSDVVLFMVDAKVGITPMDEFFANIARRSGKQVILLANKAEGKVSQTIYAEMFKLGFGEPVSISSEHGLGITDLYESLLAVAEKKANTTNEDEQEKKEEQTKEDVLQLAIVGRPNVGKSTLVNALIKDERMLVSDMAGTTRDAIPVDWEWQGKKIKLVDTAGLRKRAKIDNVLERISASSTMLAVDYAQVVVLVLDADAVLDKQDLVIASRVVSEGRALVIAINKWDIVTDKKASIQRLKDRLETSFAQVSGMPTVTISAINSAGLGDLMKSVLKVYEVWNKRVSTSKLNRWLEKVIEANPPPRGKHAKLIKLRFMAQVSNRPPSFVIFSSNPEKLPESYQRYLINHLRKDLGFDGVPLRLTLKKGENPYAKKD